MNHKNKCPFCLPKACENAFAESENFLALYNIAPILPGHSLVVPKRHVSSLMDLDEDELCEFTCFGREMVRVLMEAFGVDSFNWTIQEREEAGQTIEHLHLHLLPRTPGDLPEPGDWYPRLRAQQSQVIDSDKRQRLTRAEMEASVAHIGRFVPEQFRLKSCEDISG